MATLIESIATLNDALNGVPFSFAFLGGSVLSLLVTDKSVDAIRVTKDVDVMIIMSALYHNSIRAVNGSVHGKIVILYHISVSIVNRCLVRL